MFCARQLTDIHKYDILQRLLAQIVGMAPCQGQVEGHIILVKPDESHFEDITSQCRPTLNSFHGWPPGAVRSGGCRPASPSRTVSLSDPGGCATDV
ncbi:hypothetical protein SKAU_G00329720 [Synaphobranchus kaupii]|uniref:Uncharacterized protein n=1 Tax=Synaphobranchus kaupii TaxID=118154 RepID=A0A9Q1EQF7_SYNKA|nr:hypothetical protein SKAU_G00329720 [Synaphobranchus kaupii]